jgi:hypothetical protein
MGQTERVFKTIISAGENAIVSQEIERLIVDTRVLFTLKKIHNFTLKVGCQRTTTVLWRH